MSQALDHIRQALIVLLVLSGTAFALYTGIVGPFEPALHRGLFVIIFLPLIFIVFPSGIIRDETADRILGLALAVASAVTLGWLIYHYKRLTSEPFIDPIDVFFGILGLALVLETVRRTVGWSITIILLAFLVFAYFGQSIPIRELRHGGLDLETIASLIFYGTDGVFGAPIGVCSTFIIIIIMLGAFLTSTGGAEMFINIAKSVAGGFVGGPAKIAVVGSAMMGMITGATVANVATTGSVTIPMMKRAGYKPVFAGAVEALASSGGQLMPPIMGAAAFIMIDLLNIGYGTLMLHAIVPSILYFLSVLMIVHVRSVKRGFRPVPSDELPSFRQEMLTRGHMLIPIAVLVYFLVERYSITFAAFWSVAAAAVLAFLRPATRLTVMGYYGVFKDAALAMLPLVAICAGAGIMIGALTATGLNLKITYLIDIIGGGFLFPTLLATMVACLILGMGLPTVAAYIVLATLVPGSLISLGVPAIAAHLFIFYFAILSAITPPVCTGAYVAAGIANSDPMQTGIEAIRLGFVVFLLPFAFVYDPSLLLIGPIGHSVLHIAGCLLGIVLWAFGLEGYFRGNLNAFLRAGFIIAGALLIWPSTLFSLAGLVLGGAVSAYAWIRPGPQSEPATVDPQ